MSDRIIAAARHDTPSRELWRARMRARTTWAPAEAVLWVARRDLGFVRDTLADPSVQQEMDFREGALGAVQFLQELADDLTGDDAKGCVLRPWDTLRTALMQGDVSASGLWCEGMVRGGVAGAPHKTEGRRVQPDHWIAERMVPVQRVAGDLPEPWSAGLEWMAQTLAPDGKLIAARWWTDVHIERGSLLTKFQPLETRSATPAEPWAWRNGDRAKAWHARAEVRDEALRRVGATPSKRAFLGALAAMHIESGGALKADSFRRVLDATKLWPDGVSD